MWRNNDNVCSVFSPCFSFKSLQNGVVKVQHNTIRGTNYPVHTTHSSVTPTGWGMQEAAACLQLLRDGDYTLH